ncbi:chloride channel protein [Roseomonas terrae]|uniref:Chloride channel protein n=1 Tax=Neoroseomonas terrae TaxID=424799 RepID=A0ABS5EBV2_9PROT|nr:chloride channel protein [Neoroseomonas terrae]
MLTGLAGGLAGLSLALLLHGIQHLAYGYSLDALVGGESFLDGVTGAAPERRLAVLAACGLVAGLGWWAVYRFGRKLVPIRDVVADPSARMPAGATLAHVLLQIATVALGSPLGREVAPRELGALLAAGVARRLGITGEELRILVACGAGAGLAAVYNVPLGGTVFIMEVLLRSFAPVVAVPAMAASVIGACVAWVGLGDVYQYDLQRIGISASLVAWAVAAGPALGAGAWVFARLAERARAAAPEDARIIPFCLLVFAAIGVLAMAFPQLPGNGKGPIQLGLEGDLGLRLAAMLLVLKVLATLAALRAGAAGGLLTPGMSIGALAGVLLGAAWSLWWPSAPGQAAFALVGAVAFLAVSQRMPITAIMLGFEFTGADHDFAVPMLIGVALASGTARACDHLAGAGAPRG